MAYDDLYDDLEDELLAEFHLDGRDERGDEEIIMSGEFIHDEDEYEN